MTDIIELFLCGLIVVCAISACLSRNLLACLIIYMAYSVVMSIVWVFLEAPDLAITEAAVGAGVSGILFLMTLKKLHRTEIDTEDEDQD